MPKQQTKSATNRDAYSYRHYVVSGDRPFLPTWHNRSQKPLKLSNESYWAGLVDELKEINFETPTAESLKSLQELIGRYREEKLPAVPLGKCGMISYSLAPELLSTGSLNSESDSIEDSKKELIVDLALIDAKVKDQAGPRRGRLAIVLGRLKATHHKFNFTQSHWIVVLDQTRLLWALYANGVDNEDLDLTAGGKLRPYDYTCDTAFGADRVKERVVLLGGLQDIPFESGADLTKFQVHALNWCTESADVNLPILKEFKLDPITVNRELKPDPEDVGDKMDME